MLSLRLLGQLALLNAGRPLPLSIKRSWALVVLLACGGAAPRSRLAAQLWPALDEAAARRNLRRELARLREAGAMGLVRSEGDFLSLDEAVDLDLSHFEAAAQAGEAHAALALWRGPLADGLLLGDAPDFDDWLAAERERLRATWRGALHAAAQAAPPEQAVAYWQALLVDDPLQEQHHLTLMRLHAGAGRRAAALAQYERCKELLRRELGLAPMAETDSLAAALRAGSAAAAQPVAQPACIAAAHGLVLPEQLPFVGRGAEVAAMEQAWRGGRTILIEGVGGIGKTRLALDFVAAHGAYALARCRPGDAELPYASFTRALRALAGPAPPLGELPGWAVGELARLLPEVGAASPPIASDEERSRFFEACAMGWQIWSQDNFDAVVLDDWHHADPASRALLTFVAQRRHERAGNGHGGAREIFLLRPEAEAEADTDAGAALRALRDASSALHLALEPLADGAVFDLVRLVSGAADPALFAARLSRATAGNPFFLAETLRHLAESGLLVADAEGVWRTPFDAATLDYRELPVPASVRDAVLARVHRLPEACRRVLEAAALAAEPFAPALLAPACALSELDTVLAIEQAVQAQLLREHEAGGFAFEHDLVQQALEAALKPERRRLVHRRLALGAEAAVADPGVVASHHEASGDAVRAVPHRLAAAAQAQRLHALAEAIGHWNKALADGATPSQAVTARQGLMQAARMRCEFDAMVAQGAALQALAGDISGASLTADERADALISVADNLVFGNRAAEGLALLDGLPAVSEPMQGELLIVRARGLYGLGRLDECKAAAATALGLPSLQHKSRIDLLDLLMIAEHAAGRMAEARRHADAELALGRSAGDEAGVARALFRHALTSLVEGELARAEAEFGLAAAGFASRGAVYMQRSVLYNLALVFQAQSRHADALATVRSGWALEPPLPPSDLRVVYRLAFFEAHYALGEFGEAWDDAVAASTEALALDEPFPVMAATATLLELLGLLGETALARRLLAAAGTEALRELRLSSPEFWIVTAQFELGQGDRAAAQRALAAAPAAADIADVRVRLRHALACAELSLADVDAAAAVAQLPAEGAEGMNGEMALRGLALRVESEHRAAGLSPATLQAAQAALAGPSPYAPATLLLHRALVRAGHSGDAGFIASLASSLASHPSQQAAFLRACC